jgi:hypothetical protein
MSSALTVEAVGNSAGSYTLPVPPENTSAISGAWECQAWFVDSVGTETELVEVCELTATKTVGPSGRDIASLPVTSHRVYYGVGAPGITLPTTLEAMAHMDIATPGFTVLMSPDNQAIYVCYPCSTGYLEPKIAGVHANSESYWHADLHGADGIWAAYWVVELSDLRTGSDLSVEMFYGT